MVDKVLQTVGRYNMLQEGDRVIVALSGGADSVSLLHCLYSVKEKYNLTLYAAHLNHQLRGEEARRDEVFCEKLCEKYKIKLFVKSADIRRLAEEQRISEELCGRQERYRFFEELSKRLNAKTATAHTASDNAETLLFNLTRGMSVSGAAGIPPVRGSYIRPLIACTRADVEAYCAENELAYVTDSTNLSDGYTRNKIRHRVIPELRELNPSFELAALRFCESAALARGYIRERAKELLESSRGRFGWDAPALLMAHEAVLDEALAELCKSEAGFSVEHRHLALLKAALKNGGAVDLGDFRAVCRQNILRISKKSEQTENNMEIVLSGDISFPFGDKFIRARIAPDDRDNGSNSLVFRTRRGGERFTFAKRNLTKPLRKAMNEIKLPGEQRDGALLLCRGDAVLWCAELGYSRQGEELRQSRSLTIDISKGAEYA